MTEKEMDKKDLRIVFMGTPEFAVESLQRMVENEYNVVAVVTQPDKPVGRHGSILRPSPVKQYALEHNIPVLQPEKMKDPLFVEQLKALNADIQVVVAFRMLPEIVWSMPRFGTFNVHAALLPQYRGAAPINWAVINGETKTGVTTFFLDHDIDTGRIIMQREFDIPDDADVEYVYDGLMHLGADICIDTLNLVLEKGEEVEAIPQQEEGTLHAAPKLFKETCCINWNQSAKQVYDFVRGLCPVPGAWCDIATAEGKPVTIKIFKAKKLSNDNTQALPTPGTVGSIYSQHGHLYIAATDNWLEITELQMAGKKRMSAKDFLNGNKQIDEYRVV